VPLASLNQQERDIIRQCLVASLVGPFFHDDEFHCIFGLTRSELQEVVDKWPDVDEKDLIVRLSINNSLNNLVGFPHHQKAQWHNFISVSPDYLYFLLLKWRDERNSPTFFDLMM
jgi:hypothetical protein